MKKIRNEAKKQSASVYLTLISVIQSFALGFLLSIVKDVIQSSPSHLWPFSFTSVTTWLQMLATFQALVLCWHVNINNAIIMQRLVGLSDSYIPFVFAIPQFCLVAAIQPRNLSIWFFGLAGYAIVSFWAYAMMYFKDAREPENAAAYKILGWFPHFNMLYAISAFPLFTAVGIYFALHTVSDAATILWLIFSNLVFIVFTCFHCYLWNRLTSSKSNNAMKNIQ